MPFPTLSNSPHYPHRNKRLRYVLRKYWTSKQKIGNPFLHLSIRSSTARLLMYVSHIPCAAPGSPRRPTHEDLPGGVFSSNPFDFMQFRTLLRNGASPTPFLSITSALFPTQCRGEGISCPSAPHPSFAPRHRKSCVCHTSEKSPANSFICHTSKKRPPASPLFATLTIPPGGLCTSFSPIRDVFGSPIAGQRRAALLVFGHQSPFTSHQSLPFVLLRALSRGATIGRERRKCWETKPLLPVSKKESGQRVRQRLFAAPG